MPLANLADVGKDNVDFKLKSLQSLIYEGKFLRKIAARQNLSERWLLVVLAKFLWFCFCGKMFEFKVEGCYCFIRRLKAE